MVFRVLCREFLHVSERLVVLVLATQKERKQDLRIYRILPIALRYFAQVGKTLSLDPLRPAMAAATFTLHGRFPTT